MEMMFHPIDWYHCNIYRKRFFFFWKLIVTAKLDLDDNLHLYQYDYSSEVDRWLPTIALRAKQYILYFREEN